MRPAELRRFLQYAIPLKKNLLIKSAPGVGKTSIIASAVVTDLKYKLIISHPVVKDPTDYNGLPFPVDGERAKFLPFGDLEQMINAEEPTVVFFDDLGQASESVQKPIMQLLLGGQINEHKVSKHVTFIAATNRREDKAGVAGMLEPVKSRFKSIIDLETNTDDWCIWALQEGNMPSVLVSFMRYRPKHIEEFRPTKDLTNSPSPRTIAHVGEWLNDNIATEFEKEVIKGAAGEAFAQEFWGFLKIAREMPDLAEIIGNPERAPVPEKQDILFALSGALAARTNKVTLDSILTYAQRMPKSFEVAMVKDFLIRTTPSGVSSGKSPLFNEAPMAQWALRNKDYVI